MTFLRELVEGFDRQWNITLKGEQIKNGDLAGVVSGVLDDLFANEEHLGDYCVYLLAKEQLYHRQSKDQQSFFLLFIPANA